jgi:hypothetical protein
VIPTWRSERLPEVVRGSPAGRGTRLCAATSPNYCARARAIRVVLAADDEAAEIEAVVDALLPL